MINEIHNLPVHENKSEKMEFWTYFNVIFVGKHLKNKEHEYLSHYA